jgi:acyl-CoA reductase-like NAD-dependent aldehyde dehydrogenase
MSSFGGQANGQTNGITKQSLDWSKFYNVIDGELTSTAQTRHGINPATGSPNLEVSLATQEDVEKAMIAAKKASKSWATTQYAEQQRAVLAFADALEAESEAFSSTLAREQGRPVRNS